MIFKAIAHWWASSKLEKEEAYTQSLIRDLDRAKAVANNRIQAKKSDYLRKIKAHQEKRNKELKAHIDFMNEQLKITAGYLPELNQLQSFTFTCVDSWMHVDLCQQEIRIVSQKIGAIVTTIGLLDAYISELNKLSQRQGRHVWREFTAARELKVTNNFIEKTKARVDSTSKSNHEEFKNELKRLQSHRNSLYKQTNELRAERAALLKSKKAVDQQHEVNKKALAEKYKSCVEHWSQIAKKFEAFYVFKVSELKYVNEWMGNLKEGGTLPEIIKVIGTANEVVKCATEAFNDLNEEYQPYKRRVQIARDTKEYPETFSNDNAQRKRLAPKITAAFEDKKALIEARTFLYTRRDELRGYIDHIKPLHPDAAIDTLCEMLNSDREFNPWFAFDINTSKQKREHWEKKQKRIENATAN